MPPTRETRISLRPSTPLLLALAIGVLVIALLIVNKHTDWLELRPASGTAAAMALAAEPAAAKR
jgi:hypothetical protein